MTPPISFIFTKTGFVLDSTILDSTALDDTLECSAYNADGEHIALYQAYKQDGYKALYQEAASGKMDDENSPSHTFLYQAGTAFFKCLTSMSTLEMLREKVEVPLDENQANALLEAVPYTIGAEYITRQWLEGLFLRLQKIFCEEIEHYNGTVEMYITEKCQDLHVAQRIFFHLVENKGDEKYPFAFMATYATRDGDKGSRKDGDKTSGKGIRHVPLQYALTEYKNNREALLALLSCLNKAADVSPLINGFMASGELFHPIRLEVNEAYQFLKDAEAIERTGILCRIPNWWKKKAASVSLTVTMGEKRPSLVGFDALLEMRPSLTVDGAELTDTDIKSLLSQTNGLAFLKGKWIEVDHDRLKTLLDKMDSAGGTASLLEALRLRGEKRNEQDESIQVSNGKWLAELLSKLRNPKSIEKVSVPDTMTVHLRPYQETGYNWLCLMNELGFGSCLADDMGLGKTVQVLSFLEHLRIAGVQRVLLIVPASLLSNWQKEKDKFAPSMDILVLHGKSAPVLEASLLNGNAFLTVTTYGMASRIKALKDIDWNCVILDEAQAIKNPTTRQTKAIKAIKSHTRIAMTGTPIENDLSNLWSLFDFLDKGLMGTMTEFGKFCGTLKEHPESYAKLRAMVSPFMLRRVKTDSSIIHDLPDKLETVDYAELTKKQVVLYRKEVDNMTRSLEETGQDGGIKRKGIILSTIMKLKQICNHPGQYLGQNSFDAAESGKFALLQELCETIYGKRERVIVFTQFKEMTEPLASFLETIFHAKGFVLHGGTQVKKRGKIVEAFQGEEYVPFIVLSVKAGGTGLNLTKANHVIHFDRWWNPAVENQATDRAFRIGQTKDVLVHKIVCRGTIEEKIDELIESKKDMADRVISAADNGEKWLTQLDNNALVSLLKL